MKRLAAIGKALLASPDKQIWLTDPDCRSMATSGRGSGMVAYNVQSAVDTTNHLIVAQEVTNVGTDQSRPATMAQAAKAALCSDHLDVVADRGFFRGKELLACEQAGVAVTYPSRKPREPSRPAALGNLILSVWPRKMSIPARRARSWRTKCVRPVRAVHMTAGHNAVRESGPGQYLAFDDAVPMWVVLIAGSTGTALRAVRPFNRYVTPG